jgi:hypothetical protein
VLRLAASCHALRRTYLALGLERPFALHLVAPVVAVLRLDPGSSTWDIATGTPLRDDALDLMLADGSPQGLAVVEGLRRSPVRCVES